MKDANAYESTLLSERSPGDNWTVRENEKVFLNKNRVYFQQSYADSVRKIFFTIGYDLKLLLTKVVGATFSGHSVYRSNSVLWQNFLGDLRAKNRNLHVKQVRSAS